MTPRFRIRIAAVLFALSALALLRPTAADAETLRFAVGPYQPTASDTRAAFEPFFAYLAKQLGVDYELTVTTDWAGIAIALANGQADVAWMGPWGYVLANAEGNAQAIATVKYDGKPVYHAIIVGRPDLAIKTWPDDAKGMSISFADVGSTSGWLIPTWWFQSHGIDPKTFFKYREGASHPANEIAVISGQVDLATDYDRNRNAMIEKGTIAPDANKIVWTSDPLPNDALAVRGDLDPKLVARIRTAVTAISEDEAKTVMPPHYTGWVEATDATYAPIKDAGIAVGRLKPKP
ncbi:MAG: phosphate/phosphite/phosphonate ABC transporter substrate-binding protein [Rhodospirillales bacterium]